MQEDVHMWNREVIGGPPTRTPTRKKKNDMRQNQLRAILIFLITPTTTWQFAAYPSPRERWKPQNFRTKIHF